MNWQLRMSQGEVEEIRSREDEARRMRRYKAIVEGIDERFRMLSLSVIGTRKGRRYERAWRYAFIQGIISTAYACNDFKAFGASDDEIKRLGWKLSDSIPVIK